MACGGGHERSSIYHDHQEESLDDIQKRIYELDLRHDDVHMWDALHLKDVIATKKVLKDQREYDTLTVRLLIASWNLKKATLKGKHPDKIEMIIETIARIDPDIIALQEIASSPSDV